MHVQYYLNLSWHSLEIQMTWLDARSLKRQNWVLNQFVWALSWGVQVLSQENKETKNLSSHLFVIAIVMYLRNNSFPIHRCPLETKDLKLKTWDSKLVFQNLILSSQGLIIKFQVETVNLRLAGTVVSYNIFVIIYCFMYI